MTSADEPRGERGERDNQSRQWKRPTIEPEVLKELSKRSTLSRTELQTVRG